ncbi:S10 family peptidase [Rubrivivax albus]|uniref:Peptidase S10 n=1 Tax=Rubrivivax albus TaxID=2499835 RepID=A0A3S2TSM4_9BURK|nr:peptidase S10 [Rubrivivax albus]RVT53709.1 peptidase S10 [Rubrivivax albus]
MHRWIASTALALTALLSACGGGGGGSDGSADTPLPMGGLVDATVYSSLPNAQLAGAEEAVAVTSHQLALGGRTLAYTATAGHLIARDPVADSAQAKVFYVAYELDGIGPAERATRPVTFFYNGGPGSASVWLHLGSFGPQRLATGVPATTASRPFPLVDNAETLLDVTDLVYVDAVGTSRSQAIAPYVNRDFWGVDADAALFRDIVRRWLARHGRTTSPFFLYGESYGGPRTAVLARRLQEAGLWPAGLVLQSPALDYNSNCGVVSTPPISCAGYLPSYAATGAWHGLTQPVPADSELDAWLADARQFAATSWGPALDVHLAGGSADLSLTDPLAQLTGLPAIQWQGQYNLGPTRFRERLVSGQLLGRYDARMLAPNGSALAAEGDPSSTWLTSSFQAAIQSHLHDTLGYRNTSTYVLLGQAIQYWDFSHDGRDLPDTVPDLAAALQADPALRVLAVNGLHDLATPFHVTETDLARLGSPRVTVRNYIGGHMSFLDDGTRPLQRADVVAFITEALAAQPVRRAPLRASGPVAPAPPDRAGVPGVGSGPVVPEPAVQAPMRDPWVPPRQAPR